MICILYFMYKKKITFNKSNVFTHCCYYNIAIITATSMYYYYYHTTITTLIIAVYKSVPQTDFCDMLSRAV